MWNSVSAVASAPVPVAEMSPARASRPCGARQQRGGLVSAGEDGQHPRAQRDLRLRLRSLQPRPAAVRLQLPDTGIPRAEIVREGEAQAAARVVAPPFQRRHEIHDADERAVFRVQAQKPRLLRVVKQRVIGGNAPDPHLMGKVVADQMADERPVRRRGEPGELLHRHPFVWPRHVTRGLRHLVHAIPQRLPGLLVRHHQQRRPLPVQIQDG